MQANDLVNWQTFNENNNRNISDRLHLNELFWSHCWWLPGRASTAHLGQVQDPSGTSLSGGSQHAKWYELGQESQQRSSPPSLQTLQNSMCSSSSSTSWFSGPLTSQWGHDHLPSGASSSSGSRQQRWYALGQVSQRMISPPCWQTSQYSWNKII